jgi:hypothetical protein
LLPYRFICSTPGGVVPSVHGIATNKVCLLRGSGQHYREFVVCYLDNNILNLKSFETALASNLENNIVAYQGVDSSEFVYVEDIKTSLKRKYIIPLEYLSSNIFQATLSSKLLILKFADVKELKILLL